MDVEIVVAATVNPTESVEKVEGSIRNVMGEIDLKQKSRGDEIVLEGHLKGLDSLNHLKERLTRHRIREAARAFLSRRAEGDTLSFGLNRQAAYAGHVSFYRAQEAPLGPIQVTVRGDAERIIDYLCEIKAEHKNHKQSRH